MSLLDLLLVLLDHLVLLLEHLPPFPNSCPCLLVKQLPYLHHLPFQSLWNLLTTVKSSTPFFSTFTSPPQFLSLSACQPAAIPLPSPISHNPYSLVTPTINPTTCYCYPGFQTVGILARQHQIMGTESYSNFENDVLEPIMKVFTIFEKKCVMCWMCRQDDWQRHVSEKCSKGIGTNKDDPASHGMAIIFLRTRPYQFIISTETQT